MTKSQRGGLRAGVAVSTCFVQVVCRARSVRLTTAVGSRLGSVHPAFGTAGATKPQPGGRLATAGACQHLLVQVALRVSRAEHDRPDLRVRRSGLGVCLRLSGLRATKSRRARRAGVRCRHWQCAGGAASESGAGSEHSMCLRLSPVRRSSCCAQGMPRGGAAMGVGLRFCGFECKTDLPPGAASLDVCSGLGSGAIKSQWARLGFGCCRRWPCGRSQRYGFARQVVWVRAQSSVYGRTVRGAGGCQPARFGSRGELATSCAGGAGTSSGRRNRCDPRGPPGSEARPAWRPGVWPEEQAWLGSEVRWRRAGQSVSAANSARSSRSTCGVVAWVR